MLLAQFSRTLALLLVTGMIDQQWRNVVRVTDANYPALKAFFGGHMVRTIEAGPVHLAPEVTYKLMFDREH